ncbi:MAG TPA: Hsp20/alpha crystallin family protein [Fibrobacteria bacterium]|nr:Hsp20/alpha crystallin family protein [Fibrobacteria bacterium]
MASEVEKQPRRGAGKEAAGTAENLIELESAFLPDAAIYETGDNLFIRLDLPGVEKGEVRIDVDETNTLQMRARNAFQEPSGMVLREFAMGNYYRSFRLGEEFDKDAITAKLEDGVLELSVARKEEVKPKRISINA